MNIPDTDHIPDEYMLLPQQLAPDGQTQQVTKILAAMNKSDYPSLLKQFTKIIQQELATFQRLTQYQTVQPNENQKLPHLLTKRKEIIENVIKILAVIYHAMHDIPKIKKKNKKKNKKQMPYFEALLQTYIFGQASPPNNITDPYIAS